MFVRLISLLALLLLATTLTPKQDFIPSLHNYHTFLWANYKQGHQAHTAVEQCYSLLLAHSPPVHIYPTFIEHLFQTDNHTGIISLMALLEKSISLSPQQKMMVAQSYLKNGKTQECLKLFEAVSMSHAHDPQIMLGIAQGYLILKDYAGALRHLDAFIKTKSTSPHHFIFYFSKAQIFMQLNKIREARSNVVKSLELNAGLEQGWLLLAILDHKEGKSDQATEHYQRYLQLVGPASK